MSTPAIISGQPVPPFYMSGTGVIEDARKQELQSFRAYVAGGRQTADNHVGQPHSTVPQELIIGDVKVQVIHAADRISKYAPFSSHANEAVV